MGCIQGQRCLSYCDSAITWTQVLGSRILAQAKCKLMQCDSIVTTVKDGRIEPSTTILKRVRTIIKTDLSSMAPVAWRPQPTVHEHNRSQSVAAEGCILARLIGPNDSFTENPLDELTGLAESAGTHVIAGVLQRRDKPDPKTYLGKGRLLSCAAWLKCIRRML